MWIDYDVQRTARRCRATDRAFAPGEEFFSVLTPPEDDPASELVERWDYSREAWHGPPETAIGWWQARMPGAKQKPRMAPNEVLLDLFDRWADDTGRQQSRYVLTLLLIRRRVLRLDADADDTSAQPEAANADEHLLTVYCPSRDAAYTVAVDPPDEADADAIQSELFALLYDGQPASNTASDTGSPSPATGSPSNDANDQAA